ncbi:hypothetical protein TNCV_5060651 [Trichonephila clavipes]|nr:hypothetical protein TNCV_5060651 [Trichonephila clavipes]
MKIEPFYFLPSFIKREWNSVFIVSISQLLKQRGNNAGRILHHQQQKKLRINKADQESNETLCDITMVALTNDSNISKGKIYLSGQRSVIKVDPQLHLSVFKIDSKQLISSEEDCSIIC